MADTTTARNAVAKTADNPPTIAQLLERLKPQIARALPRHMSAERITRIALTTLRTNEKLQQCDPASFLGAVMLSAQLGLEPGPLGHAYLVPYGREVQFIIGYKGILDLARRSGEIQSIEAREVCENDQFEFSYGLEPVLTHTPAREDRGKPTWYYGVAKFKDGGYYFDVMSIEEVEAHRNRSKAKNAGPWVTDYSAMARKTVIRRMAPFLPLSVEAASAVATDEATATFDVSGDTIDVGGVEVVAATGEVIDVEPHEEVQGQLGE
jgi:recombination protein RecT